MTGWRAQRAPLIALLVSAAAVVGVHLWFDARPVAENQEPAPRVVDGAAELGGNELDVTSARWGEFEAPDGSRTLSVRIDAHSTADAELCGTFVLSEADGERVWHDARRDLDVPFDAGESSCRSDSPSYGILSVFLLPEDADGPFWFDVSAGDEEARFRVEP
ncbi:hypothetical protein [Microbacterium hydrocarbonoxydans]|uniref:hypothetical protein n=1 Tax=Microbacterium hydrocarbonoxydans TaxID=273678 RepID=UPI0007BC00A9|nr:hypothetical protein [Microbacterium hydrocarbonoxydans]GAT73649.1 putative LacI family transcriptional regulator [Microbacterium sp. HM58-2]